MTTRHSTAGRVAAASLALLGLVAGAPAAQDAPPPAAARIGTSFHACYDPAVGAIYLIKLAGLAETCLKPSHIEIVLRGASAGDPGTAAAPDGPAGGDLGGTYPNPLVVGMQGKPISNVAPKNGQALFFQNLQWRAVTPAFSGDVTGGVSTMKVEKLQHFAVAATAPTAGQVLQWDANALAWTPSNPPSGVTAHNQLTGLAADDHTQYLLGNGVRTVTNGFAVTGSFGVGTIPTSGFGGRLMWYPGKAAFRAGHVDSGEWDDVSIGPHSTALGRNTVASELYTTAFGYLSVASAQSASAMGEGASATAYGATALGYNTGASQPGAVAIGWYSNAGGGQGAVAIGDFANASGLGATAFGSNTTASGAHAPTALGYQTSATNSFATAMGGNTTASGNGATALGQLAVASGNGSVAMGYSTTASSAGAIAGGFQATASGGSSVALGQATAASGNGSVALGWSTTASGHYTTALGRDASTNAQDGSFVWGDASGATTLSALAPNEFSIRASGGVRLRTSPDLSTGCDLAAAGGVWNCTSSRAQKTDFAEVAADDILEHLRNLPIQTWRYKAENPGIRHMGPYAEDFRAAFRLGVDSLTIGHIDLGGVSLAAAKALEARTRDLQDALSEKQNEIAALRSQLTEMARQQKAMAAVLERLTGVR